MWAANRLPGIKSLIRFEPPPIFGYLALYQNLLITETGNCRDKGEILGIKGGRPTGPALEGNDKPKERFYCSGGGGAFCYRLKPARSAPFFTFQSKKGGWSK